MGGRARGIRACRAPGLAPRSAARVAGSGPGGPPQARALSQDSRERRGGAGGSGSQTPPIWSAALPSPVRASGVFPAGPRPPLCGPDPGETACEVSGCRATALRAQTAPRFASRTRPDPGVLSILCTEPSRTSPGPTAGKCVLLSSSWPDSIARCGGFSQSLSVSTRRHCAY